MSVESDLRKDGIIVIKKLNTLKINSIARNVSVKLCETFPNIDLKENELFMNLSRLNMYIAKMPNGMAEANYFYKNSSIYFNEHIDENDLEDFSIHECIHFIQERKDSRNYLLRMGLCDYTEFKIYGLGLNEAAVQLMTSKVLGTPKEFVNYFGISFETNSPLYYPLECCLVNQLSYITGENLLFDSTLNSNDNFKDTLCKLLGYKNFMKIQNYLDDILNFEEEIIKLNNKIVNIDNRNKKVDNIINKINHIKEEIAYTFIKTQNLIITSYFDNQLNFINTLEGIENYRRRLYNFKDYLGSREGYSFFNKYYVNKMMDLEKKSDILENNSFTVDNSYLIENKTSVFTSIIRFIKHLFEKDTVETSIDDKLR